MEFLLHTTFKLDGSFKQTQNMSELQFMPIYKMYGFFAQCSFAYSMV